ncbi:hypothetical protein PGTUg99_031171 [Puccinia graminis f. sp. tritici]|uniref:Uncharacterized protein n=1 Tax=Puccinia graminis f. sp. tritici TaxID=56615 RepID=A0A5B0QRI6_PUCGR|nr:hypothetical protein PGTUg99_031171 [Puccinia graminis f. sp. tritici]
MALFSTYRGIFLWALMCFSEASRCMAMEAEWSPSHVAREDDETSLLGMAMSPGNRPSVVTATPRVTHVPTSKEGPFIEKVIPAQLANGQSTGMQALHLGVENRKDFKKVQISSMRDDLKNIRTMMENLAKEIQELELGCPGTKEKMIKDVEELNYIHRLMLFRVQSRILELSGKGSGMIGLKPKDSQRKTSKSNRQEVTLHGYLLDEVKEKDSRNFVERLNNLLYKIALFDINQKIDLHDVSNQYRLKLQRLVFMTVDYMYQHSLINEDTFRYFFAIKNTLETSAINTILTYDIQMGFPRHFYYHSNQVVLCSRHSSHTMNSFKGLGSREQRNFLYLCLKVHFIHYFKAYVESEGPWLDLNFKNEMKLLFHLIFEDTSFFNRLEMCLQIPSLPKWKQDEIKTFNPDYLLVKKTVHDLAKAFLKIDTHIKFWNRNEVSRITFFILDFVEEFYPGLLEIDQISPLLRGKFKSMYSSIGSCDIKPWYNLFIPVN